jgi:hypothetical protein
MGSNASTLKDAGWKWQDLQAYLLSHSLQRPKYTKPQTGSELFSTALLGSVCPRSVIALFRPPLHPAALSDDVHGRVYNGNFRSQRSHIPLGCIIGRLCGEECNGLIEHTWGYFRCIEWGSLTLLSRTMPAFIAQSEVTFVAED